MAALPPSRSSPPGNCGLCADAAIRKGGWIGYGCAPERFPAKWNTGSR